MTNETATYRFSVVIPTYQREKLVVSLLESLARQDYTEPFEIIVVVDGSTDGTVQSLSKLSAPFPLRIIEQPNSGAATARNKGADAAQGEILLFIDDDMQADPCLLAEHDRSHREGADVVIGHMPLSPESTPSLLTPSVKKWADDRLTRLSVADPTIALRDLLTGQLSLRRELFNGTGKFDPQFTESGSFGNEDIDFGSRLLGEKHRILFNPRAITWQHYEVDLRTYLRRARETGQADVRLARKHPDQQHAIFQYTNGGKWINRFLWRHAVNLPFPVAPLTRFIDWLALKVADSGHQGPLAAKLIGWSSAIQYWRGIRASGGIPRPRMLRVLAYHAIADLAGMPILEDYGVPPKTFTNQLNTLERAGFNFICPEQFVRCLKDGAELPARALLLTFDDCYSDLLESASSILLEKKIPALAFAVSRCLGGNNAWDQDTGAPLRPLMTAAQLQELSKLGVEIGAHSRTHPFLTRESDQRLVAELCGSIDDLEATGLKRPRFLAYPFGDHDERVRNTARDANIAAAFTVTPGVFQAGDDPLRVPRIEIMRNDTGLKLLWKIGIAPVFRTKTRKAMTKKKRAP